MNTTREQIYLAALLHDIGKFYQRADESFSDKYNDLSDYSKKMANDICPVNENGRFGYQHVIWTNEFFEKFKKKFSKIPELEKNLYFENKSENNIVNLSCNHHLPKTEIQAIISLADWWSAGIDRRNIETFEKEEATDKKINWGKSRYKQIPLYSIFNSINIKKKSGENDFAFPLISLDITNNCFPKVIKVKEDGLNTESYNKLWLNFENEFEKLPTDSIAGFIESLIYLLKKYTWCIPSNTMDMANVSLFDHLKTTAAFADCIYEYYKENQNDFNWNDTDKRLKLNENKFPVILLGGDISGIQKFIYNISSRKAATSLKGRSFYLQLMIDSIIQRIISHEKINATIGHVVYSSGGKFFMLLPNINKVKESIDSITKEIEKELWYENKGKIVFNMDYVPFSYKNNTNEIDFESKSTYNKSLGTLWKTLSDKLTEKKNQKFKSILLNDYNSFFNVIETGGKVNVCAVTGEESSNLIILDDNDKNNIKYISNNAEDQIKLGTALKDADYLITYKDNIENSSYLSKRSKHQTSIVGVGNYLFDQKELIYDDADFRKISSADVSRVKTINNTNFLAAPLKGQKISYGFQFYGGNKQAEYDNNRERTYEELTRMDLYDENSETYFGVLRMDVDGLGEIFINGLSEENKSFSAYATLSSYLDWFFSGYLNTIREKYKNNLNILYSGGDDVFAVGRWDLIISFAEDIHNEFKKFVGRDDISISAGICITGNKYPIAKAAEHAGNAEHSAKNFTTELGKKNAINFLGETVSWNKEFEWVKSKKNEFVSLINDFGMPKGILHKIMLFAEIQKENKRRKEEKGFVPDLSYHWNAAYYLKRFMENKDKSVQEFCKTLQVDLFSDRKMELLALAARWAELEIKEL